MMDPKYPALRFNSNKQNKAGMGRPAHLAVEVRHRVRLNEPPPPTANERPRTCSHTRAVIGRLELAVCTVRHPATTKRRRVIRNAYTMVLLKLFLL